MKIRSVLWISLFFCLGGLILGQNQDSLTQKSYGYLAKKMDSFQFDRKNPLALVYTQAYIDKAKQENNLRKLYVGYRDGSFYSWENNDILSYVDSMIIAANSMTENIDYLGQAYDTKGRAYYGFREYKKALEYNLKAYEYLRNSENKDLKFNNIYNIAVAKLYLGYYDDALPMFKEVEAYFKTSNDPSYQLMYLRSLFRLSELYQAQGDFEQSPEYNLLGMQKSIEYGEKDQEDFFQLLIGIDDFHKGDYAEAITHAKKAIPAAQNTQYFELEQRAHYYMAKSYWELKQPSKALAQFEKFDSITAANGFLEPGLRNGYEWLIDYYKKQGDKDKELYYINRLLDTDRINADNMQELAYTVNKEYDTKQLLESKDRLENRFSRWRNIGYGILGVLFTGIGFLFYRNLKLKKEKVELQTRFEEANHRLDIANFKEPEEAVKKSAQEIPEETLKDILARLDKFESENGFLDRNLTLSNLASKFKTNTTYLSKVINSSRKLSFNNYLKKLRTDYLIELLKSDPKYRKFTLESLAEITGFASSRQLSETFYEETRLKPTEFLEMMG